MSLNESWETALVDATLGLRERKKRELRHRLGDVAARLFAERGYDNVAVADVARAADVSEQTVFNYFPTKPDLVLDRAEELLERSRRIVADRTPGQTPADVLKVLVHEDIDRYRDGDAHERGEFPALCHGSESLRRSALAFRDDQADAIGRAIVETDPAIPPLVARAHAGGLTAVVQKITERIGAAVVKGADREVVVADLRRDADLALTDAADNFRATLARAVGARSAGR